MLKKKTQKFAVLFASVFIFSILALTINTHFQASNQIYEPKYDLQSTVKDMVSCYKQCK